MFKYILLLFTVTVLSQKTMIKGVVKQNDLPVIRVFVYVVDENNNIKNYSKTDENGKFEILTASTENQFLQIKGIDFLDFMISLNDVAPFYSIKLESKPISLKTVEIKKENIVKKTGDTIRYKLKAFTNNNDRVLIDALKNLPGIEVLENGQIKYQGMAISNFYIDGDDFVSKNYNLATQNIKNELIDEIQILENDQPIKLLQGKVIPKQAALNITFKDDFKGKLIHDLSMGFGYPKLLELNYTNIAIKKKFKAINFVKFNNTGKDYLRETQSMITGSFNKEEVEFRDNLIDVNTIGTPPIKLLRFNNNENAAASFNYSGKIKKNTDFKTNTFLVRDFVQNNTQTDIQFIVPLSNFTLSEQNNFNEKYHYLFQQFLIRKNTKNFYIDNDLNFKSYISEKNASVINTKQIDQNLTAKSFELSNNFTGIKNIGNKIVFFKSNLFYGNSNQNFTISPGISKQLFNNNLDYINTIQNINNKLFFLKNSASILFQKNYSSYNLILGTISSLRQNKSEIIANSNNLVGFFNNLNSSFFKNYVEFEYVYKTDRFESKFKINPSLWQINGIQKHQFFSNDFQFNATKKFKKEHSYSLSYNFNNEPIQTANVYQNGLLSNYRNLTTNNLDYLIDARNTFEFNLKLQRTLKLLFFNASVSKSYINSNYINNTNFSQNINVNSFQILDNRSQNFNTKASIEKYFFSLKSTLKASFLFSENNRSVSFNNMLSENLSTNQVYNLSFKPTINNLIKFSSEYTYAINTNKNRTLTFENKVIFQKTENSLDIFFKDYFSMRITSEFVAFKTQNNNTNHFLDFYLNYRKPSNPFEFNLAFTNIFNRTSYFLQQNDLNIIQETNFFLRPSNILLSVFYKF